MPVYQNASVVNAHNLEPVAHKMRPYSNVHRA